MKKTIIGLLATLMLASCGSDNNPSNTIYTNDRSQRNFIALCEEFNMDLLGGQKEETLVSTESFAANDDRDLALCQDVNRAVAENGLNDGLPDGESKVLDCDLREIRTYREVETGTPTRCISSNERVNYFGQFAGNGEFRYD